MRGTRLTSALGVLTCLLLLAGCSAALARGGTPSPSGGPSPAAGPVHGYLTDAAADDPDEVGHGMRYAAPGSSAAAYLEHRVNRMRAELDGAMTLYAGELKPVQAGRAQQMCNPARKHCAVFGDFTVDGSGRLASFAIDGKPIGPRLAQGEGTPVNSSLGEVTFLTAYDSIRSHQLEVTLEIRAGAMPLCPRLYKATFETAGGTRQTASNAYGTTDVPAHTDAVVEVVFPGGPPKGRVTIGLCARQGCDRHADVTIDVAPGA